MIRSAVRFSPLLALFFFACQSDQPRSSGRVGGAIDRTTPQSTNSDDLSQSGEPSGRSSGQPSEVVATVNGREISSHRFRTLLLESRGLAVLEQLLALEMVKDHAERERVSIGQADIDAEYDRSLEELARSVVDARDADELRQVGEQVLGDFLRQKNLSLPEFHLSVDRNAYLRKMVQATVAVSGEEVQAEFDRRFGRQAIARHIVCPDIAAATSVRKELEAGAQFAEVARIRSIHRLSGSAGGLLPPFSRGDLQIPEVMREAAFALKPGEVSSTLLIDGRYHILKLDRFVEPQQQDFTAAFSERLRQDLNNRKTRQAMQDLERRLFDQADIRVQDPVLSRQFRSKYAGN